MPRKGRQLENGLSDFEELFCREFLVDLNATRAAERAGASPRRAKQTGWDLMQKAHVQQRIQELMDERAKRTEIDADRVLMELGRMGFANMLDYIAVQEDGSALVDLRRLDRDKAAAIESVTMEVVGTEKVQGEMVPVRKMRFKLADKTKALELIGKHLGMFSDRVKHEFPEGTVGVLVLPPRAENPDGEAGGDA